jgi:hypothetical protein
MPEQKNLLADLRACFGFFSAHTVMIRLPHTYLGNYVALFGLILLF